VRSSGMPNANATPQKERAAPRLTDAKPCCQARILCVSGAQVARSSLQRKRKVRQHKWPWLHWRFRMHDLRINNNRANARDRLRRISSRPLKRKVRSRVMVLSCLLVHSARLPNVQSPASGTPTRKCPRVVNDKKNWHLSKSPDILKLKVPFSCAHICDRIRDAAAKVPNSHASVAMNRTPMVL